MPRWGHGSGDWGAGGDWDGRGFGFCHKGAEVTKAVIVALLPIQFP